MSIRCYLPPEEWCRTTVTLSGREAYHLSRVLRVTPGTVVTCFDGQGHEAPAQVRRVIRREIQLELKERFETPEPRCRITLGIAVPRHGRMDQIIDQATQMGVNRVAPLLTRRGVVKVSPEAMRKKQARWEQIAIEAGKQSGVSRIPVIQPVTPWAGLLPSLATTDCVLIAAIEGPHESLGQILSQGDPRHLLVLIGPEGDFTPEEIEEAARAGAHRISLGPTVLRCETAVVASLTLVNFFLGKFFP